MGRDFYVVLGVSQDADLSQIRRAYRRLVRQVHPDVDHDTRAVERFLEVQRAYETLSDEAARAEYDRTSGCAGQRAAWRVPVRSASRSTPVRRHEAWAAPPPRSHDADWLLDAVDEMLGGFVPGVFTRGRIAPPRKDLYVELVLDSREAAAGGLYPLRVPVRSTCPECGGTGAQGLFLCAACGGSTVGYHDIEISTAPGVTDGTRASLSLADIGLPETKLNVVVLVRG